MLTATQLELIGAIKRLADIFDVHDIHVWRAMYELFTKLRDTNAISDLQAIEREMSC